MNVVSSDVEICNMALDYLNVLNITSLDEGTKQAKKCKALYDIVRKKLLTNLNASFSIERTILTEDANYKIKYLDSNKVNYYGYKNAFVIPNDCLQIICVGEPLNNELYQIEGRYLLCNREKTCPVTYIKDVDNVALYDANFVTLFALKLAEQICLPLTEDEQKYANIRTIAQQEYITCTTKYGNDNKITVINEPRFRNSKYCTSIQNTNRLIK